MSENNELDQKVREMAKLTMLSNKINEIQEKNLKMFPLVFFNGVKSVKIDYDLGSEITDDTASGHRNFVKYSISLDDTQDNGKPELRFEHLSKSVRGLFWNNIDVVVLFNGKKVYENKHG